MQPIVSAVRRFLGEDGSVRAFLDEVFRERELILRSQGRVHFLLLTRRLQMSVAAVVLTVAVWGIGMTLLSTLKSGVIQVKNDEIREARVAYEDLFDEVLRYQKKVASVTSNLRDSQDDLLEQFGTVVDVKKKPGKPKAKSAGAAKPNDPAASELRNHLAEIDRKVQLMTETNVLLEGSLGKIKTELQLAGDDRDQIIRTRTKLRERVSQLEENLITSRTETAHLARRVADLSDELTKTRTQRDMAADERDNLSARVNGLSNGMETASRRALDAETDLKQVLGKLEKTTGSDADLLAGWEDEGLAEEADEQTNGRETAKLRARTIALIKRLDDLHAAHGNVLDRLGERTVKNIEDAEKLIAMTGLDLNMVMTRATKVTTLGQGGPLFEVAGNDGTEGLPGSVSDIDSQLIRWAALQSLLKRVPLISPVDFYHLASRFGLRRDPFTKKRAMHYGVDLAGWRGAPVYNTAPGKVVFAGRKGRYGKVVEIDHGYGLRTRYGHLRSVLVKRGQVLGHRHKIGLLGSTGRSTGPHVHYEVRFDGKPLNPDKFIKAGRYVFKG